MMKHTKSILTVTQAKALEHTQLGMYDYEIVRFHCSDEDWEDKAEPLNSMSIEVLVCALYIGYTVAKTDVEQLQDFYGILNAQQKEALRQAFNIMGIYVDGVNK
jgi:hypothetical protein